MYPVSFLAVAVALGLAFCLVYADDATGDCPPNFIDAVRSGLWSCAKQIADVGASVEMRSALDLESRVMLKELNDLKNYLESNLPVSEIHPAYQWAQSEDEIFLSVKFAHKMDTPGTLNVEAQNVTLTDDSLYLFASNGRKNFVLSIVFLRDIDPDSATWSMASVGRMSITIKKKTPNSKWARLHKDRSKKVPNQHFWWDKHESFAKALEKLPELHKSDKDLTVEGTSTAANENDDFKGKENDDKNSNEVKTDSQEKTSSAEKSETSSSTTAGTAKTPVDPRTKEYKSTLKKMTKEHKSNLSAIDAELKSKKTAVDEDCKKQTQLLDSSYSNKRKKAIEEFNALKAELKANYTSDVNSVSQEL